MTRIPSAHREYSWRDTENIEYAWLGHRWADTGQRLAGVGRWRRLRAVATPVVSLSILMGLAASVPNLHPAAADPFTLTLTLEEHRFTPAEVDVPAGERFRVEVHNQDNTPAEFESSDLRVEKVVVPGGKIMVMIGPLKPGAYRFFDDYHPDTATGTMTARESPTLTK